MTRKLVLAAAALVALSGAALVSTGNAFAGHGGHGGGHGGGMHGGGMARAHIGFRAHFRPHLHVRFARFHHHGNWCWRFPWRCRGGVRYVTPSYVSSTPTYAAAPTRTCLTKQYLQDGSILFKDVCANEQAISPSPNQQQPQAAYGQQSQSAYYQAPQNYQPQPAYQGQSPYQGQVPYQGQTAQ